MKLSNFRCRSFRRPRENRGWLTFHASFMSGSYVGVVAATAAEVASRVPGWDFGLATGLSTRIVTLIGFYLIHTRMPQTVARLNPRRTAGRMSAD